jgi:hypothetical protein
MLRASVLFKNRCSSCRPTTACSDPGWHKVHAPHCIASVSISVHAPRVRRSVSDAGRWATL